MLFKNVKIHVKKNFIIENGFILVENGKIKKIGEMIDCPENEESLDFSGFKILPGLIDPHCHVGLLENCIKFDGDDLNEISNPITPNLQPIDAINPADSSFHDALKNGITTIVVSPGSSNPIAGKVVALKTYGDCIDEMIVKKNIGVKFSLGENPKNTYSKKGLATRMQISFLIRNQLEKTKSYLKLKEKNENFEFDPDCEALINIVNRKEIAFFHCHRADDIFTAIRISKEFNLNFVLIHATEGHLIKKHLKGLKIITGPLICEKSKPELKNLSEINSAVLFENGSEIAICTDHPATPIQFLNISYAIAIREGLKKEDSIHLINQNAAKIVGIDEFVGTIEVNKLANFNVYYESADVFSPYCKPKFVVAEGKIVIEN